jgi:hypothetical protein
MIILCKAVYCYYSVHLYIILGVHTAPHGSVLVGSGIAEDEITLEINYIVISSSALPLPTSKQPTMVGVTFSKSEVVYGELQQPLSGGTSSKQIWSYIIQMKTIRLQGAQNIF